MSGESMSTCATLLALLTFPLSGFALATAGMFAGVSQMVLYLIRVLGSAR